jgi:hypothetical protein
MIVDAERDAMLAYLDAIVMDRGGGRGRAQVRTPTEGLTWAVSRHATTRVGDPQVHDHVLVANNVRMGDEGGGWKGLDAGRATRAPAFIQSSQFAQPSRV